LPRRCERIDGALARGLGLVEQSLRSWVEAAKAGKLHEPGATTATPEQMEISQARARNVRLWIDRITLRRHPGVAAAMFLLRPTDPLSRSPMVTQKAKSPARGRG
jgi:transposase-like protein